MRRQRIAEYRLGSTTGEFAAAAAAEFCWAQRDSAVAATSRKAAPRRRCNRCKVFLRRTEKFTIVASCFSMGRGLISEGRRNHNKSRRDIGAARSIPLFSEA